MTGPDHYRKAEELAKQAEVFTSGAGARGAGAAIFVAIAQVHATLAHAAATAIGSDTRETTAWREVAGTKLSG